MSLGPRIPPLWMVRVIIMIVMDWTRRVVSEEEVSRLDNRIHLINRRMLDCIAQPKLVRENVLI